MTFIGFLLGLAVGIVIMYLMAGTRAGNQKQGGNKQRRRMGSPAFNTEFGQMDDASQTDNQPVKPAASSAAVFQQENNNSAARQATASNQAGNERTVTNTSMADDTANVEVENSARDSFTTNTVYNNTTNADAAINNAVTNPTPGITDQAPVNPATNGAGATETKGANMDKQ